MGIRESSFCRAVFACGYGFLLTIGPMGCNLALAQDAGMLLREQERRQELERLQRLPVHSGTSAEAAPAVRRETGETILIKDILFSGKMELLSEDDRAAFALKATGQQLGVDGLYNLADSVTLRLQEEGFLLAKAILPPQDVTEGLVTIEIVEGTLESVALKRTASVRAREDRLRIIADSHIAAQGVRRQDLEAALLRMNDLPGITARAKLTPGEAPNTSMLVVDVEQAPIFSGQLSGDNSGSSSTGWVQANAGFALTDLTGYGELIQIFGTFSQGQKFGQAALSMPIGASGFTASANYGYLDYRKIDDVGSALDLHGSAHFAGLGLDYTAIRSRDFNLRFNAELNGKALVDESLVERLQDKRVYSGTLGVSGDARDVFLGGGLAFGSLSWTYGDLDLSREASALAVDQAGLMTQGGFHRVNASLARLQDLPGDFSFFGRVSGQWTNKNLDSSEDFSLGGPHGVRGFGVGSGSGDLGALGTIELRFDAPIPAEYGALQLAGFVDAGHVWVNKDSFSIPAANACGCNDYGLASAGISARWTSENVNFSASYAYALGDDPGRAIGTSSDNQRFWLSGGIEF